MQIKNLEYLFFYLTFLLFLLALMNVSYVFLELFPINLKAQKIKKYKRKQIHHILKKIWRNIFRLGNATVISNNNMLDMLIIKKTDFKMYKRRITKTKFIKKMIGE